MNHKINVFVYICKTKKDVKIKKDIIKKFIPTKKKSSKNIIVKYLLCDRKNKSYIVKKKWKINYILNKTKKKKNHIQQNTYSKKIAIEKDKITKGSNLSNNFLDIKKKKRKNNSNSYNKLLNKITKNIQNYTNTTIINTGLDTYRNEKNVFLYGNLFTKYLNEYEKKEGKIKKTSKYSSRNEKKYEENISENKIKSKKDLYNSCKDSCTIKKNYYKYKNKNEEFLQKKGLIKDLYDRIIKMNYENIEISISSWIYKNYKIVDILKKRYQKKKNIKNKKGSFCHKCFINNFFENFNLKYSKLCNHLPYNKTIKKEKNLRSILKYIIRKYVKIIKNRSGKINVCFIFKYKILINNQKIFIYFINFPLCNVEKNKIFYNINNEKSLLFLFNRKIINSLKNISDYSNFLFPFNSSKNCQKAFNLKKKIIYFIRYNKYSFKNYKNEKKEIIINNSIRNIEKYKCATDNDILIKKEESINHEFTKYNKKDMIFHILVFELLIRLIFENSKTYFTIFISEIGNDYEYYRNIYYLNLSKIIKVRVKLKNAIKKKKKKSKLVRDNKNVLNNLLKENYKCKNIVDEKDEIIAHLENEINKQNKVVLHLKNEINEKNKVLIHLKNEISKNKSENIDKLKIIENLKSQISKKEISKSENIDELSLKNNNYIKKLYNENNLLKEKIKKLNNLIKKEEMHSKTTSKLNEKSINSETTLIKNLNNKKEDENNKLNFFIKAFEDTEQKLYTADVLIKTQKEIMKKIKKDKNYYFEEINKKKFIFKKELESSLDFIYSVCEDIKTKKEKICLKNRINILQDCINKFLNEFEKDY